MKSKKALKLADLFPQKISSALVTFSRMKFRIIFLLQDSCSGCNVQIAVTCSDSDIDCSQTGYWQYNLTINDLDPST